MRLASVIVAFVAVLAVASSARADLKLARQYAGRVVISPDPPPTIASELRRYVAANAVKGDAYEAIKGSPWKLHLVGFLSADVKGAVMLELVGDPQQPPLHAVEVTPSRRVVIAAVTLTTAAGFEANQTYVVRLVAGRKVLAKAQLRLRE